MDIYKFQQQYEYGMDEEISDSELRANYADYISSEEMYSEWCNQQCGYRY